MSNWKAFVCKCPVRIKGNWNTWFSDEAIVVYAALYSAGVGIAPLYGKTNISTLAISIFDEENPTRQQKAQVKKGLLDLYQIDSRWIEPLDQNQNKWKVNNAFLFEEHEKNDYIYGNFCFYELRIIQRHTESNVMGAMAFYVKFRSIFDYNYGFNICHFSYDDMEEKLDMAKNTIYNYIRKFNKIHLIDTYRPKKISIDGKFRAMSNVYYLPGCMDLATEWAEKRRANYVAKILDGNPELKGKVR